MAKQKQKAKKPPLCPRCGLEMDKLAGIGHVCNECGYVQPDKKKG